MDGKLCHLLLEACVVDISKNQFWEFLSIVFSFVLENKLWFYLEDSRIQWSAQNGACI